ETLEANFPIRYLFRRRRMDSGGPGKYRGGTGLEMAIVAHDAPEGGLQYVISGKGQEHAMTDGLGGGYPGARNRYIWVHNTNEGNASPVMASRLHDFPGKKQDVSWGVFPLKGRDVLYVASNGGGGYLDPFTRDPEAVLNDVRNRIASRKAAREVYGTVISETIVHDVRATLELRERLASRRGNGSASGMSRCVSETLNIRTMPEGARICCRSCAHALAPAGHAW